MAGISIAQLGAIQLVPLRLLIPCPVEFLPDVVAVVTRHRRRRLSRRRRAGSRGLTPSGRRSRMVGHEIDYARRAANHFGVFTGPHRRTRCRRKTYLKSGGHTRFGAGAPNTPIDGKWPTRTDEPFQVLGARCCVRHRREPRFPPLQLTPRLVGIGRSPYPRGAGLLRCEPQGGGHHPLTPLLAIPCTKTRCATRKTMIVGSEATSAPAMTTFW